MLTKEYTTVLTIAGSDGSGGAGIQADLKTVAACGCYGLSVITSVTAQNTRGVVSSFNLPPEFIREQFMAIADDMPVCAVKTGMIGSKEVAETLYWLLNSLGRIPVVIDPVLHSTNGNELLHHDAMPFLKEKLFPLASLITPNLPEAARLTGRDKVPSTRKGIEAMARELHFDGTVSVLVKGGHGDGVHYQDCLLHERRFFWFTHPPVGTVNTHGTGCTLSAAIASFLARKYGMAAAVEKGIDYTQKALRAGASWHLGKGHGPLQHFPENHFIPFGSRPIE